MSSEQCMQFVNRDGATYWVPADRDLKINGIKRWDQAFRIYAAIYSKANPTRSSDIWQYIYVIHTAAATYTWENVAYYDYTFHQLMAERPGRNWGKTYLQLWNLAMCDPVNRNSHPGQGSGGNEQGLPDSHQGDWRDWCCWRFNRGAKCKKWNCRFDHRCSNCESWSHNATQCTSGSGKHHHSKHR